MLDEGYFEKPQTRDLVSRGLDGLCELEHAVKIHHSAVHDLSTAACAFHGLLKGYRLTTLVDCTPNPTRQESKLLQSTTKTMFAVLRLFPFLRNVSVESGKGFAPQIAWRVTHATIVATLWPTLWTT